MGRPGSQRGSSSCSERMFTRQSAGRHLRTPRAGPHTGPRRQEPVPTSHFHQTPCCGPHGADIRQQVAAVRATTAMRNNCFGSAPDPAPSSTDGQADDHSRTRLPHVRRRPHARLAGTCGRPSDPGPVPSKPDARRRKRAHGEGNATLDIRAARVRRELPEVAYPGTVAWELPAPGPLSLPKAKATGLVADPDGGSGPAPPNQRLANVRGPTGSPGYPAPSLRSTALGRTPDTARPSTQHAR